ncbi:hypothetical protein ACIRF8_08525 [Streptomyces sp. NPDC102406]|uniref:hypothetical protein n=1 Tax=Streptomyces sp. NPDC102406 TaxID=3366171 RepID=UPI00381EB72D
MELASVAWELGGLDLLVNNAGVLGAAPLAPLEHHPLNDFRAAFEVDVVGRWGCSRRRCRRCGSHARGR